MSYIVNSEDSVLITLMHVYLRGKQEMPMSSRKIDEARREGRSLGFREGVAEGLAALLTERRVRDFVGEGKFPWVEHVMPHEVEEVLKGAAGDYWKPRQGAGAEERAAFDQKMADLLTDLMKLARPDSMVEQLTAKRRELILLGSAEPLPEDKEWLEQQTAEAEIVARRTNAMLRNLGVDKVSAP